LKEIPVGFGIHSAALSRITASNASDLFEPTSLGATGCDWDLPIARSKSIYGGRGGVVTGGAIAGHSANLWDLNTKGISKNSGRRAEFVEAEIRNERPCHRNKPGFVANIT